MLNITGICYNILRKKGKKSDIFDKAGRLGAGRSRANGKGGKMDNAEMRRDRQERILRAIRHEKNDRTPLMMSGDCALARYAKPDATFAWMLDRQDEMYRLITEETLRQLPKIDSLGGAAGKSPRFLGAAFLGPTRLPGRELPENEMWQPVLGRMLQEEDYTFIADNGWNRFRDICLFERIGIDREEFAADMLQSRRNTDMLYDAGFPFLRSAPTPAIYDFLCISRGVEYFFLDIMEQPELVHAAMDTMLEEYLSTSGDQLRALVAANARAGEATMVNVNPCVYANCDMVSRAVFEEFGWPLIEKITNHVLDCGAYVFFHMDTNWTKFLDYFRVFPKGRCIFDTDGKTDLAALRDMHGDRFAITGNVSPTLLAFGTPDKVYEECRRQIEMMGEGFILAPACSLPANTPAANIDAMYAAL